MSSAPPHRSSSKPPSRPPPPEPFDLGLIGGQKGLDFLISEVRKVGARALEWFKDGIGSERKPDRSPVTEADRQTEAQLRLYIETTFPDAGFFGEEGGENGAKRDLRFIVDPIDG